MVKVTGLKKHTQRLKSAADVAREVTSALYSAGQEIELDAENSITQGSVSGAGHVPSLPGEPPNRDTGFLDTNIETTIETHNPPKVHVTSNAPYSAALEYGTSKMAERPFMRPATEKNRREVGRMVAQAVRVKIRRG
ncbi:HK97-gp10 family putative phage morphogenesis protein [Nitratireductor sp. GCM10026969]|uniref:HK97-gp10 family putative phage morphogenesis protein n=1 Tax=Nitratireductor sp. GCM10026969 TaxID=3252645 RepID=UPI00361FC2AA